jgi:hypothetical protein
VTIASSVRGPAVGRSLDRCVPDVERFLDRDWGCRADAYPGTGPSAFADLLTLDDVDRFLTTTALRTPFFRLVRAGERIPESSYTRSGRAGSRDVAGIADPSAVAALFGDGATIVLQGLHRWSEPVARFCRDLELELGFACQVNAYITPGGAQGLELHADPHDVFVLQVFGRKRWQIHAAPGQEREPLDAELAPGGTIYMPAGTRHAASAQQGVSGHLTVGVHVASWGDVVRDAWRAAARDASLDDRLPAAWHRDPSALAHEFASRLGSAADRLRSTDAAQAIEERAGRFLSSRPQLARGAIASRASAIELDDAVEVMRRPGSVCELRRRSDALDVLLGDRRLVVPPWLEPAMRRIGERDRMHVGDLDDVVPDAASRRVLVDRLIREGLLAVADPDPQAGPR